MTVPRSQKKQTPRERRELRKQYRFLANEMESEAQSLLTGSSQKLVERLNRSNDLFSLVTTTQDAVLDSTILLKTVDLAAQKARQLKIGSFGFDIDDFVQKLKEKLDDGDEVRLLNLKVDSMLVPRIDFMHGPIEVVPKERTARQATKKVVKETMQKPQEISVEEAVDDRNDTSANVEMVYKCLLAVEPVKFLSFVINPDSFSQTIENIFYVSFLIRDGKVAVSDEEELIIETSEPPENEDESLKKLQNILHLDMDTWEMTSHIRFTPLSGAHSDQKSLCYVLEIDQSKLLLDCGFNVPDSLKELGPTIDAVLLSHGDFDHIGGYVKAFTHYGLTCPCFVTTPIHDMGIQLYKDYVKAKREQTDWTEITLEDVEKCFSNMTLLRYSQPHGLTGKSTGIKVTAFGAGRTIGGSVWKIKKDSEDIIYAVDINHRKERHLKRTMLLSTESFKRPSLLITDAYHDANKKLLSTKDRDYALKEMISDRIRENSNILIPIETSTRILELCLLLDSFWQEKSISYHLVFLSHQSQAVINAAKTMLEWMGEGVAQSFGGRDQAFDFRNLKCLTSLNELDELIGPKLVLTSFPGLDYGFGHDLLLLWGSSQLSRCCIIFPEEPPADSISAKLFEKWNAMNTSRVKKVDVDIPITLQRKIPLEGDELQAYLEKERNLEKEAEVENVVEMNSDADESDLDDEENEELGPQQTSYDTYVKDQSNRKGFFKQAGQFRMYPVHEVRHRVDEYGEIIDPLAFSKFQQKIDEEYMDVDNILAAKEAMIPEPPETPSKYVALEHLLEIHCLVGYMNFEGRVDGPSMETLIKQLAPRKLMIVHGTDERSADMVFQFNTICDNVFAPAIGDTVSVSEATNMYQVVLTDSLMNSLQFSWLNEYSLTYISGVIRKEESNNGKRLYLDPLAPAKQQQHPSVTVGELKLSFLNRHLVAQGFVTQFAPGGVLVVNGKFVVRKGQTGITVEGSVHPEYYKLREVVYSLQAML